MDNQGMSVRIRWLPQEEHGRLAPPAGPTYFATIKFAPPTSSNGEWSVRLHSMRCVGRDVSSAVMSFVSEKAPTDVLARGDRFELFEGRWPVATGQVMSACGSIVGGHPVDFMKTVRLLKELHLLSLGGHDQGIQGDAIRTAIDEVWWQLSDVEQQRLDGLSEDLYSIGGSRATPARVDDQIAKSFERASASGNWDGALEILRRHEAEIPSADVAALRGVAWGSLGHHDIAALFFAEAARFKPEDVRLKCLHLRSLVRAGDYQRAKEETVAIARTSHEPLDLLLAADVLFDCEHADAVEPNTESFGQIAALAERALKSWRAESASGALSRIAGAGFLSGAISLAIIGEDARSDSLYAIAQALLPDSLPAIPRPSQRNRGDSIAPMLQTKHQIDAQLLLSN